MPTAWPPLLEPAPTPPGRALSIEEWAGLGEDEPGELVGGHLEIEEVADATHELCVTWLIRVLGAWLAGRGFVFGSELKMALGPNRGRKADVVVLLPGAKAPPRRGALHEPPDVVIEVVTPTPRDERRDRVEKMSEYARFGVRFYWLVDPALGSFEIFERAPAGFTQVVAVTEGTIDCVPGCDGLAVDVDALWAELARLRAE
ncbi:MAG: Uma2 family endonuclease [Polyangiaceae bacterium]|nr:Uma2 family endonuclease [Polyangiaceae bacterium]